MARICTICSHKQRKEIEAEMLKMVPIRKIASRFGLSSAAVQRHQAMHVARDAAKVVEISVKNGPNGSVQTVSSDHMGDLQIMRTRAEIYELEAAAAGKIQTALAAIATQARLIELQAKLQGLIQDQTVVILSNPLFAQYNQILLEALAPYPEAREAVMARLESLCA